jgi:hypothetical protein
MANKQYIKVENDKKWKALNLYYNGKKTPEQICKIMNIDITTFNEYRIYENIDVNGKHKEKQNVKFTFIDNINKNWRYGQCQK